MKASDLPESNLPNILLLRNTSLFERLLVYEVKDGWKPLCEFLGVEVPEEKPFPRLNDTEAFKEMVQQRRAQMD